MSDREALPDRWAAEVVRVAESLAFDQEDAVRHFDALAHGAAPDSEAWIVQTVLDHANVVPAERYAAVRRAYGLEAQDRGRLESEVDRLREDIGVVIYHAENLQRYINKVPVRDLTESRMAFENAKRSAVFDDFQRAEDACGASHEEDPSDV